MTDRLPYIWWLVWTRDLMQWVFYDFIADEKVRMIGVEAADLGLHS